MEMEEAAAKSGSGSGGGGVKTAAYQAGEVDTSVPFESVKEAVNRFGGLGFWKPILNNYVGVGDGGAAASSDSQRSGEEVVDSVKLEEQAVVLEKELIKKERETLDVLKELESAKRLVEDLKSKLRKEESEAQSALRASIRNDQRSAEEEKEETQKRVSPIPYPSSSPALILMQLKQAKLNITRTNHDLAESRAMVDSLNMKLEKERISLEKTHERFSQNTSKISSLEEELKQTRLQAAKYAEIKCSSGDPSDITRDLHRLSSEAEHFKKMGEAAKSEVSRTVSEIERTKIMITTAEIRLVAARKMKEAAIASEAAALAEIDLLSNHQSSPGNPMQKCDRVTLSIKEYADLISNARDAEEQSKKRVADAMLKVDEANLCKLDILIRMDEATGEVKASKMALVEALERVEAANREKIAFEEALRKWQSEGYRRRSAIHFSTKFKTSYPSHQRRDSSLILDPNELSLVDDEAEPVLRPTLSIGQILSNKLFTPQELEAEIPGERSSVKNKVSLGQMLSEQNSGLSSDDVQVEKEKENDGGRRFSSARKKIGFARFSLLLWKQQKKKKKRKFNLR